MIRRLHLVSFYARLVCNLLPTLAFALAWLVRFSARYRFDITDYDPVSYVRLLVFVTAVWALAADHYRLAAPAAMLAENTALRRAVSACAVTYMVVLGGLFFYRGESFSRVFLAVSAAALLFAAVIARAFLRCLIAAQWPKHEPIRLIVVGADSFASRTASRLEKLGPPCRVSAFVRVGAQPIEVSGAPVCELADLRQGNSLHAVDEIVLALSTQSWPELPSILDALDQFIAPVRVTLDFGPGVNVRDQLWQFGHINLLELDTAPFETISYVVLKRALDVAVSIAALLLMSPIMLAIAVALRVSSPGPVLFVQDRVGFNGKVFRMYKFRSMEPAPAAESDTEWSESSGRCTRLGAFLRRRSLDELPQFFNVLKGEMSVVGPRPERPHFVRQFLQEFSRYNRRHRLKVGMTGWAQVNGLRGNTSIRDRLEHDLFYLQNWSLGFDLRIIAMTAWSELFGRKTDDSQRRDPACRFQIQRGHSTVTRTASRT